MTNVWVVTGSSTGLGKSICLSALKRGHKVIATCRGDAQARLSDLVAKGAYALSLDVTAAPGELEEFARKAIQVYGHVDVLCNNAGYVQFGAFEELSPEEIMKQYSTLVFGPLNLSRVFLPHMRERRTGCIGNIGSRGSQMVIPGLGAYVSAKAALAALSQTLAVEVKSFGIRVVCIEPGDFRTDVFTEPIMAHRTLKEYSHVTASTINHLNPDFKQPGDPQKGAERIVDLLSHVDAEGKATPSRLPLGTDAYESTIASAQTYINTVEDWKDWTKGTEFDED